MGSSVFKGSLYIKWERKHTYKITIIPGIGISSIGKNFGKGTGNISSSSNSEKIYLKVIVITLHQEKRKL